MDERSDLKVRHIDRAVHLSTKVAGEISREILTGRLKPGDKLPTEPELSQMFGVSRTVVREAVARLRSEGIVRSKQGAGVFVTDGSKLTQTLRIDPESLREKSMFKSLFELRAMLEISAAGLATERGDKRSIAALEEALKHLREVSGADEASVDADLEFHCAIAQATGNPFIATFIRFISFQVRESIITTRLHGDPEKSAKVTYAEHLAIFEAIRSGRATAAKRAMSRHIINATRRLGVA